MDLGIANKLALVTASGHGLGRSIAINLAKEGAKVAVVSRTRADIDALVKEIGGARKGHYGTVADLTEEDAPRKLVEELFSKFGKPSIVVHNLGGALDLTDPFCSVADWRKVWRINIEVAIELNLLLLPPMRQAGWGRIVHISSIAALENQGTIPYCTSKAALTAYARSLGRVLAPEGIIVTAVLPGAVFTEKGYWDIASKERPEHVEKYLADRMAIHRFGTPDEIGTIVTFMCSEQASFCVGSVVPVDGGQGRTFFGI